MLPSERRWAPIGLELAEVDDGRFSQPIARSPSVRTSAPSERAMREGLGSGFSARRSDGPGPAGRRRSPGGRSDAIRSPSGCLRRPGVPTRALPPRGERASRRGPPGLRRDPGCTDVRREAERRHRGDRARRTDRPRSRRPMGRPDRSSADGRTSMRWQPARSSGRPPALHQEQPRTVASTRLRRTDPLASRDEPSPLSSFGPTRIPRCRLGLSPWASSTPTASRRHCGALGAE